MRPLTLRPAGSIRCPDCKGFGYLATDAPMHRGPCRRCKGSGICYGFWICPQSHHRRQARQRAAFEWSLALD